MKLTDEELKETNMLRDGWNFHGDIAISLEHIASHYYGDIGRPVTKIYDADAIEQGNFVEVMIILLREQTGRNNEYKEIEEFVRNCAPYLGVNGNTIPKETAQELFDRFNELYS